MSGVLERKLAEAFERQAVKPHVRDIILENLAVLENRDKATEQHCIRIGLYSEAIAAFHGADEGYDARAALMAGTLHDIGKALVPGELLRKTGEFTAEDRRLIEPHVMRTYELLMGILEYTGQITVRHHRFQDNPYPQELPVTATEYTSERLEWFDRHAEVLSIADFFDAATVRSDSHGPALSDLEAVKLRWLKYRPRQAHKGAYYIDEGILTPALLW
jgi:HD-GYP domain-containing protein (c-di-GMP phosphodiesterase class II)